MPTLLAIGTTLAVLALLAGRQAWPPEPSDDRARARAAPCWMMLGPLRAVTADGSTLHLRLALDACDSGSQEAINSRRSDLEAIVRMVVAEHRRQQLEGTAGMRHLREALKLRLGAHVQGVGAKAVHDVVVDQFVLRRI